MSDDTQRAESELTPALAKSVSVRLRQRGFEDCTVGKVLDAAKGFAVEDSALESAILQELEELGFA